MLRTIACAALLACPVITHAQASPGPSPANPPANTSAQVVLPPNTEIVVTPNDTVTTKGNEVKEGYKFTISTVFDVMVDGVVVIPKGTPGEGTVTWMTNKGAFGKSGKMEVSFNSLNLGGQRIALTGKHRQEGEGNTGATVGAVVAVGVFGAFVTGHSASITNGMQLRARTAESLAFNVPASAIRVTTATLAPAPAAATISVAPVATPATPVRSPN